jgi:hypothetical protein
VSPPDDQNPPHDDRPTLPADAANDTEPPSVIGRGLASRRMSEALTKLVDAYLEVERVSMACAAGLDATVDP